MYCNRERNFCGRWCNELGGRVDGGSISLPQNNTKRHRSDQASPWGRSRASFSFVVVGAAVIPYRSGVCGPRRRAQMLYAPLRFSYSLCGQLVSLFAVDPRVCVTVLSKQHTFACKLKLWNLGGSAVVPAWPFVSSRGGWASY